MNRPVFTIVAGSNGSGKTSLTSFARTKFQHIPILDPDAIAKSLQETWAGASSNIEAGKQLLYQAEALIEAGQSFTVETTLSGSTYLKMSRRAKAAGFNVVAFFIGTSSIEVNLERVRNRVRNGGHDISVVDQHRRYPRTLANMQKLLPLTDLVVLFDNSTEKGHTLVGVGHPDFMDWIEPVPAWSAGLRTL